MLTFCGRLELENCLRSFQAWQRKNMNLMPWTCCQTGVNCSQNHPNLVQSTSQWTISCQTWWRFGPSVVLQLSQSWRPGRKVWVWICKLACHLTCALYFSADARTYCIYYILSSIPIFVCTNVASPSLAASSEVTQAKGWNEDNDVVHSDEKVLRLHMQSKASEICSHASSNTFCFDHFSWFHSRPRSTNLLS